MEDLVLEEHLVLVDGASDRHVLAVEGRDCSLLASLELGRLFGVVIRVVTIEVAIVFVVLASLNGLLDFVALFLLLLGELLVKTLLFLLLLDLGGKGPPGELDRYRTLVHDLIVLMGEKRDGSWLGVDVALGKVDVVVVGFADHRYLRLQPIVLQG